MAAFNEPTFGDYLARSDAKPSRYLDETERQLTGFLEVLLAADFAALQGRND